MSGTPSFSLMIHGGAGTLDHIEAEGQAERYLDALGRVLEHGRGILASGGSALDAVEACAALLEDEPLFNAGAGSVLDEDGRVAMDAALMDGATLRAGAVAAVRHVANPVRLARLLLEEGRHVMLAGEGAVRFADRRGVARAPDHYFLTPARVRQWEEVRRAEAAAADTELGTVGAVARDREGHLAAATSTGGLVNKRCGRVGDSPVPGAGVYADDETCAVSCTGSGEDFLRTVLAKTVSDLVLLKGLDAPGAAARGIDYLVRKVGGRGGLILIDRDGRCAARFTTPRMVHGWIEHGGPSECRV
jgi:beta-aspartyl-peptidase (threonine type)